MKKFFVFLVAAVMALSFGSCEKNGGNVTPEPEEDVTVINRIQVQPMGRRIFYMLYDDASGKAFVFPLILAEGQEDAELGKTYVYPGEMDKIYAYWMLSDYTTYALYTQATFKMIQTGNVLRIDATATDTNGDSWKLRFEEVDE